MVQSAAGEYKLDLFQFAESSNHPSELTNPHYFKKENEHFPSVFATRCVRYYLSAISALGYASMMTIGYAAKALLAWKRLHPFGSGVQRNEPFHQ